MIHILKIYLYRVMDMGPIETRGLDTRIMQIISGGQLQELIKKVVY